MDEFNLDALICIATNCNNPMICHVHYYIPIAITAHYIIGKGCICCIMQEYPKLIIRPSDITG